MRLGDLDALKEDFDCVGFNDYDDYNRALRVIEDAPEVSIKSCRECPFVADEEKQITNGDAWKSYCEGQEVGFKKAEDVFERMKLIQETVNCIRNTFKLDTESDKLVRNCMALVQNAIDGEYHDMEEVDVSEIERPQGGWISVSERLPDDRDWYLGIFQEPDTGFVGIPYICDYIGKVTKGTTNEGWILRQCTDVDSASDYFRNLICIAWQPLPKPYELQEVRTENGL